MRKSWELEKMSLGIAYDWNMQCRWLQCCKLHKLCLQIGRACHLSKILKQLCCNLWAHRHCCLSTCMQTNSFWDKTWCRNARKQWHRHQTCSCMHWQSCFGCTWFWWVPWCNKVLQTWIRVLTLEAHSFLEEALVDHMLHCSIATAGAIVCIAAAACELLKMLFCFFICFCEDFVALTRLVGWQAGRETARAVWGKKKSAQS